MPPHDDGLPAAGVLLDAAAMAPHLSELFGRPVDRVRVRYLDYVPGRSIVAQYDARTIDDDTVLEASATAEGSGDDGFRLYAAPDDAALPLLGADAATLVGALDLPPLPGDTVVRRLAWVPARRAVLRCGPYVVKLYADPAELAQSERALALVDGVLPTARLVRSRPERGIVAQEALAGVPVARGDAIAGADSAAAILHVLHGARIDGLDDGGPAQLLAAIARPAALVSFAVPELAGRVAALAERLRETQPHLERTVPVHGDFNVGQLLADGDRTFVVDVDTLAAGSPAADLAAYVANLHNGRNGDAATVNEALDALVSAYGHRPDDLDWHLAATMLRRVDRPFRRLKKRWPERTAAIVGAIEELVH